MTICGMSVHEFKEKARRFHGHLAPGILCGGFMVELALRHIPKNRLHDAISETRACLPDAIQLLTPCTIGNGWMKVMDTGRFAMVFYDKETGEGVRISLNSDGLSAWPAVETWVMKKTPKSEQDKDRLFREIEAAGTGLYKVRNIHVDLRRVSAKKTGIRTCPVCGESFRANTDGICPGCLGETPYTLPAPEINRTPLPVASAIGKPIAHDLTRVIPGKEKGALFRAGTILTKADLAPLKAMGKEHILVAQDTPDDHVHEDEAALTMAPPMAGDGIRHTLQPHEGRIDLVAKTCGVLTTDRKRLFAVNRVPGIMLASRPAFATVSRGEVVAGTRAIPLYLPEAALRQVMAILKEGPLFTVHPFVRKKAAILITGTEVAEGRIEDRFTERITETCGRLRCGVVATAIAPDDRQKIRDAAKNLLLAGADLLIATGGMSVDPDDVTRFGLQDAGLTDILYGAPVLPGAMSLVGRIQDVRVIGVPAGALFFDDSAFDRLLPRLMADMPVSRNDIAAMADGGLLRPNKRRPVETLPVTGEM